MKKILAILLSFALALGLAACVGEPTPTTEDNGATGDSAAAAKTTIIDREGKEIERPKKLDRIVSAAPAVTEILVDLGLAENIVAIDLYTENVAGIKPDVVKVDMLNPNAEALLALQPDLVLASGMSQYGGSADPFAPLKDAGVSVVYIPTSNSLQSIMDDIAFIADLTNTKEKGEKLISDMKAEIEKIKAIGSTVTEKKKVYFEISPAPSIYTFGSGTFLNEMIEIIGAKNIFADQNSWLAATAESVIALNPDVILTNVSYLPDPVGEIKSRSGWENVTAIKNGAVYQIDVNSSSHPSHLVTKALKQMAEAIYPELYK